MRSWKEMSSLDNWIAGFQQGVRMNGYQKAVWILAEQALVYEDARKALDIVWPVEIPGEWTLDDLST